MKQNILKSVKLTSFIEHFIGEKGKARLKNIYIGGKIKPEKLLASDSVCHKSLEEIV